MMSPLFHITLRDGGNYKIPVAAEGLMLPRNSLNGRFVSVLFPLCLVNEPRASNC